MSKYQPVLFFQLGSEKISILFCQVIHLIINQKIFHLSSEIFSESILKNMIYTPNGSHL